MMFSRNPWHHFVLLLLLASLCLSSESLETSAKVGDSPDAVAQRIPSCGPASRHDASSRIERVEFMGRPRHLTSRGLQSSTEPTKQHPSQVGRARAPPADPSLDSKCRARNPKLAHVTKIEQSMVELSASYDLLNHKTGLELDPGKQKLVHATKLHLLSQMDRKRKDIFTQYYLEILDCVIHLPMQGSHSGTRTACAC